MVQAQSSGCKHRASDTQKNNLINPQRYRGRKDKVMANKTINLKINNAEYSAVPVEVAKAIEVMLAQYKTTTTATTKSEPKKAVEKVKVYTLCADEKSVTVGNEGAFIPTKVFKGVTYSLKQAGASWDKGNKNWVFKTKKACKEWCDAQDARA